MKLSDDKIEKLNPPDGRWAREIPDAQKGLYLALWPSGVKAWSFRYRFGDRTRKMMLGRFPDVRLAKARALAEAATRVLVSGIDPAGNDEVAVAELKDGYPAHARSFVERHCKARNRGWKEQARQLGLRPNRFRPDDKDLTVRLPIIPRGLADRWAQKAVTDITKKDIVAELDRLIDKGSPIAANRQLAVLRRFTGWLVERDVLTTDPCMGVKMPSAERSRDRVLSDRELGWLWRAADAEETPIREFIHTLILTAQRRGEVAYMREDEIEGDVWTIPGSRAKNGNPHLVPLSPQAQRVMARVMPFAHDIVFTTTGMGPIAGFSKLKARITRTMLDVARKDAGSHVKIAPWTLHDIRRSAGSGMAALGTPPHIVDAILNHVSGVIRGVSKTYNRHAYFDEKREALIMWSRHIDGLLKQ